jgi:hypothetical protein
MAAHSGATGGFLYRPPCCDRHIAGFVAFFAKSYKLQAASSTQRCLCVGWWVGLFTMGVVRFGARSRCITQGGAGVYRRVVRWRWAAGWWMVFQHDHDHGNNNKLGLCHHQRSNMEVHTSMLPAIGPGIVWCACLLDLKTRAVGHVMPFTQVRIQRRSIKPACLARAHCTHASAVGCMHTHTAQSTRRLVTIVMQASICQVPSLLKLGFLTWPVYYTGGHRNHRDTRAQAP